MMNNEMHKTHAMNIGDLGRKQIQATTDVAVRVENVNLFYGETQALKNVNMTIPKNRDSTLSMSKPASLTFSRRGANAGGAVA